MAERFIPSHEVQHLAGGISLTTIWRMRRKQLFPEPVAISPGRKAWLESDIAAWIASRTSERAA